MENNVKNENVNFVFNLLKYTFVIVPIVAGADKFLNILTDWTMYLSPTFTEMLPFSGETFMMIVGVIEIAAGLIVLKMPKIGGLIVAGWLTLVALSLLAGFNFVDVAVRDLVMAIAALSMSKLA